MKINPTYLLFFALCCFTALAQQNVRVLFIGNSYVTTNNLPQMLKNMAQSAGHAMAVDYSAPGGQSFSQHVTHATTLQKINQGNWDFVVLQEQSQRPSFSNTYVQNNVFPYAAQLNDLIEAANPCAETVFYMTWGRKNGDQSNCAYMPAVCTYEGMDNLLQLRYRQMAEANDALVAPVAAVWRYLRTHHPEIELYSSDESHPALAGTYAAAATFYSLMFREDPTELTFDAALNAATALAIRQAAKTVVYEQLAHWFVGLYDAPTELTPQINQLSVHFATPAHPSYTYEWQMGDGTELTTANPTHTYAQAGVYTVTVKIYACGEFLRVLSTTLTVGELSQAENPLNRPTVYPNPTDHQLIIPASELSNIQLFNMVGQPLSVGIHAQLDDATVLDTTALPNGNYQLLLTRNGTVFRYTICVLRN